MEDDNKLILERKKKFDRLKENYNPYPNSFKKTSSSQSIIEKYGKTHKNSLAPSYRGNGIINTSKLGKINIMIMKYNLYSHRLLYSCSSY